MPKPYSKFNSWTIDHPKLVQGTKGPTVFEGLQWVTQQQASHPQRKSASRPKQKFTALQRMATSGGKQSFAADGNVRTDCRKADVRFTC